MQFVCVFSAHSQILYETKKNRSIIYNIFTLFLFLLLKIFFMFMLPDLLYEYSALEPFIDKETMKIHHDKHHGGYVEKLNVALTGYDRFLSMDIETLINSIDDIPDNIRPKVINQGGGHVNHSLFWTIMGPNEKVVKFSPNGNFKYAIETTFNDLPTFIDKFSESATDIFGSGWSFLVINNQKLEIISKQNQD